MRGLYFFTSLLASISFVAADANSVRANIAALQNYTQQLNGNTILYNGSAAGIAYALQVQQDAVTIYRQAKTAIADANASAAFSSADSSSVYSVLNTLANNVKTALNSIVSKANTFAELKPIVLAALYQLRGSTNTYADSLIAKLASADKTNAQNIKSSLNSAFGSAITTYGGTA